MIERIEEEERSKLHETLDQDNSLQSVVEGSDIMQQKPGISLLRALSGS